jgi:hypothetical protein
VVVEGLAPGDEGEAGEGLGLEFEGKVEVLENVSTEVGLKGSLDHAPGRWHIHRRVHHL